MGLTPRRAVGWLIAVSTVLRLGWSAALEPSNDESYHWLYTVHPALSYFDHPPMTMWVAKAGIALCGGWVHPLSLRLGFVLLFAGSTWVLFRWTADLFGGRAGWWAAAALNLTGYYTAFGGIIAVPDSPFLFFALLTFWKATKAVRAQRRLLPRWAWVGVAFAGALLSKYHAVLLPAGVVLYALLTPGNRKLLWSPGPYLAVLIGAVGFLPVIVWNAQHEWASIRFQGGRAGDTKAVPFLHDGPLKWLAGPVLYLLPWIWFWLVVELVRGVRRFGSDAVRRLLVCLAVVPLLFFFLISGFTRGVLLHWPLVGFLPLYPLVGANWERLRGLYPRASKVFLTLWTVTLFALAGLILAQARFGVFRFPPGAKDPAADISGWESVAGELDRRGILSEPDVFLSTNIWYDSGQLAFAVRGRVPVACYHTYDARGFAFWSNPEDYVGKTGYLVIADEASEAATLREYAPFFQTVTVVAEFPMLRGGTPFRRVKVYRCDTQTKPYPFDFKRGQR
jgi:4-amino-4-deoxy-L-arabinose transferase-like glycosyltransferase